MFSLEKWLLKNHSKTVETNYNVLLANVSVFFHLSPSNLLFFSELFLNYYVIFNYNDEVTLVSTIYYDWGLIMEDHDFMNGRHSSLMEKKYMDIAMLLWTKSIYLGERMTEV